MELKWNPNEAEAEHNTPFHFRYTVHIHAIYESGKKKPKKLIFLNYFHLHLEHFGYIQYKGHGTKSTMF